MVKSLKSFIESVVKEYTSGKLEQYQYNDFFIEISKSKAIGKIVQIYIKDQINCSIILFFKKGYTEINSVQCISHQVDFLMTCALYFYVLVNPTGPLVLEDAAKKDGNRIFLHHVQEYIDGKRKVEQGFHYYSKWGFIFDDNITRFVIEALKTKRKIPQDIWDTLTIQRGVWIPIPKTRLAKKLNTIKF